MITVRVGFFITISITFCLTSVIYCHPNESGINRHQSQKLSRLLKRETLGDVYHSLEAFENDEESLPNNSQIPLKRSIFTKETLKPNFNCKSESNGKTKEEGKKSEPEKTSEATDNSTGIGSRVENPSNSRVINSTPPSNKSCLTDIFKDTEDFFEKVNADLKSLSNQLSTIFNQIGNKTSDLIFSKNATLFDTNKCKLAKNSSTIPTFISDFKQYFPQIFPTDSPLTPALASLRINDNVSTKISTCIENIRNNITSFSTRMREKITGDNVFSNFVNDIKNAVSPVKNYNFTSLDRIIGKIIGNNGTANQTLLFGQLIQQNAALGILGQFLNKLSRGISGFVHVISRKWSHEDRHPHNHGLVGSIKHVLGWPSHTHREPNWFHKMFSLPNLHWKHHDEHVPLLKKILKIPDHHHHHHHHPGSIIKHLLNSLYSIFHLSDHCECPQGSNSPTSCPANNFFSWLGGRPTPHQHHHHRKHIPGHINLHHNVMTHKQPACSCS